MVNNSKAFNLAKYAIMFATIFVAMMIDRGISAALPISMAICVLLVTFSFCFIQNSWADGIVSFTCFGVASFIKAFIFPDAIVWYYKPLVYVIPRVLAGAACFGIYRLMLLAVAKLKNRRVAQVLAMTAAIAVGLVCNTVFFLLPFSYLSEGGAGFVAAIKGLVFINILPEYLTSLLIVPWVVLGVRRGLKLGIDGNNWRIKPSADEQPAEQEHIEGDVVQLIPGESKMVSADEFDWEITDNPDGAGAAEQTDLPKQQDDCDPTDSADVRQKEDTQ